MPAFQADTGMPIWLDLTTSDVRKSAHFYATLLGWEVEELTGGYRLARLQGMPVAGFVERPEYSQQPDTWVTYFLSDDVVADCIRVEELGGRILAPATTVHQGDIALVVDTAGAVLGLMAPASGERFIAAGEPGTPVWHELTATTDYAKATQFYPELFGWMTASMDTMEYTTALVGGAAFAGIYNAEGAFPPEIPSFWQTYLGVRDIEDAARQVADLGGEVIRAPWLTEFGRMSIIADATGAMVTLCEVDEPVEEPRESDPLEGIDLGEEFGNI